MKIEIEKQKIDLTPDVSLSGKTVTFNGIISKDIFAKLTGVTTSEKYPYSVTVHVLNTNNNTYYDVIIYGGKYGKLYQKLGMANYKGNTDSKYFKLYINE